MKTWTVAAALLCISASALAQTASTAPTARKSCDDLKAEIAKKLDAKNVVGYTLDAVDKGKESADAKIIGRCDGGTKSIVYNRSSEKPKATEEAKKQ
jgi:hypothetical protein